MSCAESEDAEKAERVASNVSRGVPTKLASPHTRHSIDGETILHVPSYKSCPPHVPCLALEHKTSTDST